MHVPAVKHRAAVCSGWEFLGLKLDREKNADTPRDVDVAANESAVRVLVIHTQEDWQIAVECFRVTKALFSYSLRSAAVDQ
jgi:acetate kinase